MREVDTLEVKIKGLLSKWLTEEEQLLVGKIVLQLSPEDSRKEVLYKEAQVEAHKMLRQEHDERVYTNMGVLLVKLAKFTGSEELPRNSFTESLANQFAETGSLSTKQVGALLKHYGPK